MKKKRDPGKLYCEKCEKEIEEGQVAVDTPEGFFHYKCKHPAIYRKMKTWRKSK